LWTSQWPLYTDCIPVFLCLLDQGHYSHFAKLSATVPILYSFQQLATMNISIAAVWQVVSRPRAAFNRVLMPTSVRLTTGEDTLQLARGTAANARHPIEETRLGYRVPCVGRCAITTQSASLLQQSVDRGALWGKSKVVFNMHNRSIDRADVFRHARLCMKLVATYGWHLCF